MTFSTLVPWSLFAATGLVAAWSFGSTLVHSEDHEFRRWKTISGVTTSEEFASLITSPPRSDMLLADVVADWTKPHVAVYSAPQPPRAHPTLRDLADSGQAHAIDFLAKGSSSEPRPWTELQTALLGESESVAESKDPFRFDRVLVATVTKGMDWRPGDRMVWTRVFVQPINFAFTGYTVAGTENASIKVASVEATSTRKLSADIAVATPGADGYKASLAPSSESTSKTSSEVSAQYEKLGIDIRAGFLRIIRESEAGGDVAGNTTVGLSMLTDLKAIRKTFPGEEKDAVENIVLQVRGAHLEDQAAELDPFHASLDVLPQNQLPHCPLRARVWMLYEERRIDAGGAFYDEGSQDISLLRNADNPRDVDVVEADDVSPAVWSVKIAQADSTEPAGEAAGTVDPAPALLSARVGEGHWRELVFTDSGLASQVAHWLRIHPNSVVSGMSFNFDGRHSLVPVKKAVDECAKDRAKVQMRAGEP